MGYLFSSFERPGVTIFKSFTLTLFKRNDFGNGRIFLSTPGSGFPEYLIWSATEEHVGGVWGSWKDVNKFDLRISLTYLSSLRTHMLYSLINGYLSAFL